jgi:predicted regulator of Ras-like GTPase activity (Roadblock/LC7/MglB family)
MNPSNFWFDPEELSTLARDASTTSQGSPIADSTQIDFGTVSKSEHLPRFASKEDGLHQRCATFLAWISRRVPGVTDAFLTNAEGLPIASAGASHEFAAVAASFMASLSGVNHTLKMNIAVLTLNVRHQEVLQLVFVDESAVGALVLGLVTRAALSEYVVSDIHRGLKEFARSAGS